LYCGGGETLSRAAAYKRPSQPRGKSQMTSLSEDAVSAALLGAVLGYLAHAYWPTLEWLIRLLIS